MKIFTLIISKKILVRIIIDDEKNDEYCCQCILNYILLLIGCDKIQAILCPRARKQQSCVLWLQDYFKKYGDYAPNRDEIKLLLLQKQIVYDKYVQDYTKSGIDKVDKMTFYRLWCVLFPKCVNRPWCDIPGKCDTCYWIDELRRESRDSFVQEKLLEAHALHRQQFMAERLK